MKKIFVTVTLFVALAAAANAQTTLNNQQVADNTLDAKQVTEMNETDRYREHILQSEEVDKHIVRFYDIDHIIVKNASHATIRIYDEKWRLLEQTNEDVDKQVRAGNYYITSSTRIKGTYCQ